eukprot:gene857-9106_t
MHRLFGSGLKIFSSSFDKGWSGNGGKQVDINDTLDRLDNRAEALKLKIEKIDKDLLIYKDQLKTSRSTAEKQRIKQKCMQLLQQKKMYESQSDSLYKQQMSLEQTTFVTNQLKDNLDTVQAMKQSTDMMKNQFKQYDIDKISDLQDEMYDMMLDADEINDLMSRNYTTPEMDDMELLDELDALESDMNTESNYLDDLEIPSRNKEKEDEPRIGIQN